MILDRFLGSTGLPPEPVATLPRDQLRFGLDPGEVGLTPEWWAS